MMDVAAFLAACASHPLVMEGGVVVALFMAGLTGSVIHCAGMCGAVAAAQCAGKAGAQARLARLVPYHLGRVSTYAMLGVVASALSQQVMALTGYQWLASVLLFAAGGMFLLAALSQTPLALPWRGLAMPVRMQRWLGAMLHGSGNKGWASQWLLGVALGFIPCGLMFSVLMLAAALASPWQALVGMLAFGLGTVPAVTLAALAMSSGAPRRMGQWLQPVLLGFSGVMLCVTAGVRL